MRSIGEVAQSRQFTRNPPTQSRIVRGRDALSNPLRNELGLQTSRGVGSIGVALKDITKLIESDAANIEMANTNVMGTRIQVIHAPSEKALDHITGTEAVIVDPPRAGLHPDVTAKLIEAKPPIIAYLSCNPSTHARDVKMLLDAGYELQAFEGYNFFPRTPHIETLAILTL